jgi:preprotein translocase subunit Sec63
LWEPWTPLGLEVPFNMYDGFNPPGLKKQYRQYARMYHPDKVSNDIEPEDAKKQWENIQRANDCLSDKTKFDNWMTYGNPEGSVMARSMDIALPSFLKEEANQIYVLVAFFASIICVPIVIILKLKDTNDLSELLFDNGIHKHSSATMIMTLMGILDKNIRKKVKVITDDQWVEVFENSKEVMAINDQLAKKNNFRDMIRNIIKGLSMSDKFDDAVKQIDDTVPRLTTVLAMTFSNVKFIKSLAIFNAEKDCKVQYTPGMLFE